jgi:acetylornithine deacetylase/succinyl-diaminopimelate desuccinylase-like protein
MPRIASWTVAVGLGLVVATAPPAAGADDDALGRLAAYIEVDTTNPPGNEARGVAFFASIFEREGIPYEFAESAPGRGNIWARLPGGDAPALVLLHHMDVVPATAGAWETDPLTAVEKDGHLYGRGALDTKSLGIMHLEAFLALHRRAVGLERDVVFMATADEEAGGAYGAGWLVQQRPDLFDGVGFLLNEGGGGSRAGDRIGFRVEVAQKVPVWLRLIARDTPGHGSSPRTTSAPGRLVAALERIRRSPFEPRVLPPVRAMFSSLARAAEPEWREPLADIDAAILDPALLVRLQAEKPRLHALVRNTCSITVLSGSNKINVVPPEASAELDCRVLPDQDVDRFIDAIRERVSDDAIQVEKILAFSAAASSTDTELFRALERVSREHYPEASVIPSVATGFTDSHFFRDLGIVSYGYSPAVIPEEDLSRIHGNDERIGVETFRRGVRMMTEIVETFAAQP